MAVGAIDQDGDGAIVLKCNSHVLLEPSRLNSEPRGAGQADEMFHEGGCLLGWGRHGEAGTAALPRFGKEGELADDEEIAPDVERGAVEPALLIWKDAQADGLLEEIAGVVAGVTLGYGHKKNKAAPDGRDGLPAGGDGGAGDPLEEDPHERPRMGS